MPRISVIMPCYNGARFLAQAIQSVQSQTFTAWELIVVDDGSTDATPEILADFTDARIINVWQENQGEAAARNAALDRARGEYIAFLDADDLYLPNALGDLSTFLDQHPDIDVAFSDGYFCDESDRPLRRLSAVRPGRYTGHILDQLVLDAAVIAGIICTMTRRTAIARIGVRFDTALSIGPDWDFWIQLARSAAFGYVDRLTCMYRVHATNITRTSGRRKRRLDLVYGRLKVMNSDWFDDLSLSTRSAFFHQLLIGLLSGEVDRQREVLSSAAFLRMPALQRAVLWRNVATDHLLQTQGADFATECLRQALRARPGDRKSEWLARMLDWNPLACGIALRALQVVHRAMVALRDLGQRRPKPVPAALRAVGD